MKRIYTIIKWKFTHTGWVTGDPQYTYNDTCESFMSRKAAGKYLREALGAKYERGYYCKGDYLYTIKQTKLVEL